MLSTENKDLLNSPQASKDSNDSQEPTLETPQTIEIDFPPERYEEIRNDYILKQHALVRPYIMDFFKWLTELDPIDVYGALENGETIKTFYDRQKMSPYRLGAAAARGLLKSSKSLRERADKAFSLQIARLVLRFENREVYDILKEFDPEEKYLKGNIQDLKIILGIIKEEKK